MGLPIILAFIVKHSSLSTAYAAAEVYGFAKVYRRLLEGMRLVKIPKDHERVVRSQLKLAIRFPLQAYKAVTNSETADFLVKYSQFVMKQTNLPPFFLAIANMMYKKTPLGKFIDVFEKASKKY